MTNANYTHITFILDRSGSMSSIRQDVIGGFNSFVEDQKKGDGKCTFTLVKFDNEYEVSYNGTEVALVQPLNSTTYVPRGTTALLDAIGRGITETGAFLAKMSEEDRPLHVIFVIQTDGAENASVEYTHEKIKEMISHQTDKYSWKFVYLGADQDAFAMAHTYGINAGNTMAYANSSNGNTAVYGKLSEKISLCRTFSKSMACSNQALFTEEDQKEVAEVK